MSSGCGGCLVVLAIVLSCVVLGTPSLIEISGEAKAGPVTMIRLDYHIGLYRVCLDTDGMEGRMSGCDTMDDNCKVTGSKTSYSVLSSDSCSMLKPIRTWFDISAALGFVVLICACMSACTVTCALTVGMIVSILASIACSIATGYAVSLKSKDEKTSLVDFSMSMESKYSYGFAFLVINTILYFAIAISLSRARRAAQSQQQANNYMPMQTLIITQQQQQQPAIVQQSYNINTNNNQQYHVNSYPQQPYTQQQPPAYVPPEPRLSDTNTGGATHTGTIN